MALAKNVPAVRFEGFSGAWVEKQLSDVCEEFQSGKYIKAEYINSTGTYPVFGGNGLRGYTNLTYNYDGTYALIGRQGALCGNMSLSIGKAYFTEHAIAVKSNEFADTVFLYYLFALMKLGQYSGQSAQPGLAVNKLKALNAFFATAKEQTLIGSYFQTLDTLIAKHQHKHYKLLKMKKALLEKMFPKQGASVPEVRFKGFSGEWEVRTIFSICAETHGGGTPSTSIPEYWNGNIPWIQSSDLQDENVVNAKARKLISKKAINNSAAKLIPKDSIAIVSRVGVGKVALMEYAYSTSQDFLSLSKLNINALYGVYVIWRMLQREKNFVQGTSIKGITNSELLAKTITIPLDDMEQTHIGTFFQTIDTLITQHQTQIKKLSNLKQACLAAMFV
ncbi:MAG: restriction endonuclease subunit S [Pseudomonadota bacterium]|nr:restriction endonuclease subunit S [Pseudomonadota bacterium]